MRRVARAESKLRLTRSAKQSPKTRLNAKSGEGLSATERRRKWRSDPANRKREQERRAERKTNMTSGEQLAAKERARAAKKRYRQVNKLVKKAGGETKHSAWVKVYGAKALEHPQENTKEIEATIEALAGKGFRIVKEAITTEQLAEISEEVEETTNWANNGNNWADTFSHVDGAGRLVNSSERQLAPIPDNGATQRIAQELVHKYLGKGWAGEMMVKEVSLLDTESPRYQIDHTDYPRGQAKKWRLKFPLGAVIGIEKGSVFSTFDGSVDEGPTGQERVELALEPRSVVFFLGCKPHRGGRYIIRNKRVHFLAAPKDFVVPTNGTFIFPGMVP